MNQFAHYYVEEIFKEKIDVQLKGIPTLQV